MKKKNNTWNIRRLVDNLFVPSSKQPSVLYCKLTDFMCVTAVMRHLAGKISKLNCMCSFYQVVSATKSLAGISIGISDDLLTICPTPAIE